eukprot:UN04028
MIFYNIHKCQLCLKGRFCYKCANILCHYFYWCQKNLEFFHGHSTKSMIVY